MLGTLIKIFLYDGEVTGIRTGEIFPHSIYSISCPRNKVGELSNIPESNRPGVYFLIGKDENTNEDNVYIGEAENVFERIKQHSDKGFWGEVVLFMNKDNNLTKAHAKQLESRLIEIAKTAKRYKIENSNNSQLPTLHISDIHAMEHFLIDIKILLGVFGHKILENLTRPTTISQGNINPTQSLDPNKNILQLRLNVKGYFANGLQTNEGVVVLKGSEAARESTENLAQNYKLLREQLEAEGKLQLIGEKLIFQEDCLFDTASPAAAVIVGYNINGRKYWIEKQTRKSLKEIEEQNLYLT